jgi:hypothetical protein
MKIILIIIMVALLVSCIIASAEPVAVGGDFGRTWISNYLAQNPEPAAQDTNNTLTGWGGTPKVIEQNDSSSSIDWLGERWLEKGTIMGNQTPPTNYSANKAFQPQPFFISKIIRPIHQIDASFNQTIGMPQPDSNGLINGWPAETYYAIGPALDYF